MTPDRSRAWFQWVGGTLLGVILAGAPAAILVLPQLSAIAAQLTALEARVYRLETGTTTPISAEARARLDSLAHEIAGLRDDVKALSVDQKRLYDRLLDGKRREGKVAGPTGGG